MNCEKMQQHILLADTGELEPAELRALDAHLATCDECRAYRADLGRLHGCSRAVNTEGPRPATISAILDQGAARAGRTLVFPAPVIRILAYAAVLAVALSTWFVVTQRDETDRVEDLHTIMAMVSDDASLPEEGSSEPDGELKALARELLEMQGMTFDVDEDWLTPLAEPESEVLQGRRTAELQAKTYV